MHKTVVAFKFCFILLLSCSIVASTAVNSMLTGNGATDLVGNGVTRLKLFLWTILHVFLYSIASNDPACFI